MKKAKVEVRLGLTATEVVANAKTRLRRGKNERGKNNTKFFNARLRNGQADYLRLYL